MSFLNEESLKITESDFLFKITQYSPSNGPGPTVFSLPIISLILSLTTLLFFVTLLLFFFVGYLLCFASSLPETLFLQVFFHWLNPSISVFTQSEALSDSPI